MSSQWPPRCINGGIGRSANYDFAGWGYDIPHSKVGEPGVPVEMSGLQEHCVRCGSHLCFACARNARDAGFVNICYFCTKKVFELTSDEGRYEEWRRIRPNPPPPPGKWEVVHED